MLPFANETVTLYHRIRDETGGRTAETWERQYLTGCSWRRTVRSRMADSALIDVNEAACRIPLGQTEPSVGDLLVRGVCSETPATAREIINFPLFCPKCKRETKVNVVQLKMVISDEPDA